MMGLYHATPTGLATGIPMDAMGRGFKLLEEKLPNGTLKDVGATVILFWDPALPAGSLEITLEDGTVSTSPLPKKKQGSVALLPGPCVARLRAPGLPGWAMGVTVNGTVRTYAQADAEVSLLPIPAPEAAQAGTAEARRWLVEGEVGESSRALCCHLTGVRSAFPDTADADPELPTNHPLDPDDLRRCLLFFQAVPQAREHLPLMADVSPSWAALVPIWDELEGLMTEEERSPSKRAPLTYARMKAALDAVPPRTRPRP